MNTGFFRARTWGPSAISKICLLFALVLTVSAAQARDAGGGGDNGDGGRVQKIEIILFKGTSRKKVRSLMIDVAKNWDKRFVLTMPNSTPAINTAIINLARIGPHLAESVIYNLGRTSKKKIRRRLGAIVRAFEAEIRHLQKLIETRKDPLAKARLLSELNVARTRMTRVKALFDAFPTKPRR